MNRFRPLRLLARVRRHADTTAALLTVWAGAAHYSASPAWLPLGLAAAVCWVACREA